MLEYFALHGKIRQITTGTTVTDLQATKRSGLYVLDYGD